MDRATKRLAIAVALALALAVHPGWAASDPEGFWISDDLTPGGLGATLRFTADGQVQATSGTILRLRWKVLERLADGYVLSLQNPFQEDSATTVELRKVDWGDGMMVMTSESGGMRATLRFVSKGLQGEDPEFLGRWTGSVDNKTTIWEFTDDGMAWMRSPSRVGQGTYRIKGEKIVFDWYGEWPPVVSARIEGESLVCKGKKKRDGKTFLRSEAALKKAFGEAELHDALPDE